MKSIHFHNIAKSPLSIFLLLLSVLCFIIYLFEPFHFENPIVYKSIFILGLFLNIFGFSKIFWYKNFVQWNKKGVVIKIDSYFKSTSLSYIQIKTVELSDKTLKIHKHNQDVLTFNLQHIKPSDQQKLYNLINSHLTVSIS